METTNDTHCGECNAVFFSRGSLAGYATGTGVGRVVLVYEGSTPRGMKICYTCAGRHDKEDMIATGKFVGYLTRRNADTKELQQGPFNPQLFHMWYVSNWPGSLEFVACSVHKFRIYGIERERTTCRFIGPDGYWWSGVHRGTNNQIVRCKRTKEKVRR